MEQLRKSLNEEFKHQAKQFVPGDDLTIAKGVGDQVPGQGAAESQKITDSH